jgi:hypothetical protein
MEFWSCKMNCEEFEVLGLDTRRDSSLNAAKGAAGREHVSSCARCAALQDSRLAASDELRSYAETARAAQAPARVEMRLRQEFRMRHRTSRVRRAALVAGWALAAAAIIAATVSWIAWRDAQRRQIAKQEMRSPGVPEKTSVSNPALVTGETPGAEVPHVRSASAKDSHKPGRNAAIKTTDNDSEPFTFLPGSSAAELDDAAVFRVRMQCGALGALGLPVNEERAGDWVLVDLLVSDDGLPQAVRLPR